MKSFKSSLILLPAILGFVAPLFAYDSSGGQRIEQVLNQIEFQDGTTARDPLNRGGMANGVLFAWNDASIAAFKERIGNILNAMPLDVADIPATFIKKIVISNSTLVLPSQSAKASQGLKSKSPALLTTLFDGGGGAGWNPESQELRLAGEQYLEKIVGPDGESDYFPATVFHEFLHIWQLSHPVEIKPFAEMKYSELAKEWNVDTDRLRRRLASAKKEYADFLKKESELERSYNEEESLPSDRRKWKTKEDFEHWVEAKESQLEQNQDALIIALDREEKSQYEALNLPSRYGGSTGRKIKDSDTGLDMRAIKSPEEYMTILGELIWTDPSSAAKYYSSDEIAWMKQVLFKGRPFKPSLETQTAEL